VTPDRDTEHLRQLSVAYLIYAALQIGAFFFGFVFFGIAVTMILRPDFAEGAEPPDFLLNRGLMTAGLVVSFLCIALAYCSYRTGMSLKRRKNYAFCRAVATLNCLNVPAGTILGGLTLSVMKRPAVREMFGKE
jgi:hypothetical protein